MAYSSLGAMLRDKRESLTQQQVCQMLGLKDVYKWSDIELGKTIPDIALLAKIFAVLGLGPEEQGEALLLGGYPPTRNQVDNILNLGARRLVDNWEYPGFLMDFTWRLWYVNKPGREIFSLPANFLSQHPEGINLLELILDPGSSVGKKIHRASNWPQFLEGQIANFKQEHFRRQHEPWFRELVSRLLRYPEFAEVWRKLEESRLMYLKRLMVLKGFNHLEWPAESRNGQPETIVTFSVFAIPVASDERLRIRFFFPAKFYPEPSDVPMDSTKLAPVLA